MKLKNNVSFESIIRSFEELYNRSYNELELAELKLCYDNQLPLDKFARLQAHWRMQEARRCLELGIDLLQHAKECYSRKHLETTRQIAIAGLVLPVEQMKRFNLPALIEIRNGLYKGIDVSVYAKPEFNWLQMREIREGLERGLDVSVYAKTYLTASQMHALRDGLILGFDMKPCVKAKLDVLSIREEIERLMKESNFDSVRRQKYRNYVDNIYLPLKAKLDLEF